MHEFFQSELGGAPSPSRRGTDPLVEIMATHIQRMREDMGEMKQSVMELTKAVTKLVLLEERQANTAADLAMAKAEVRALDARLQAVERVQSTTKQVNQWVMASVGGAAGMLATLAMGKLFGG